MTAQRSEDGAAMAITASSSIILASEKINQRLRIVAVVTAHQRQQQRAEHCRAKAQRRLLQGAENGAPAPASLALISRIPMR
jgi:precorrin-6B methylase 1